MNNQSNKRPPDPRDYDMYSAFRTKERGDARRQQRQSQKSSYFDAYAHRAEEEQRAQKEARRRQMQAYADEQRRNSTRTTVPGMQNGGQNRITYGQGLSNQSRPRIKTEVPLPGETPNRRKKNDAQGFGTRVQNGADDAYRYGYHSSYRTADGRILDGFDASGRPIYRDASSSGSAAVVQRAEFVPDAAEPVYRAPRRVRVETLADTDAKPFPFKIVLTVVFCTSLVMAVLFAFMRLNEYTNDLSLLSYRLSQYRSEASALQAELVRREDLLSIEQTASEVLGMVKVDVLTKKYVTIENEDKTEVVSKLEEEARKRTSVEIDLDTGKPIGKQNMGSGYFPPSAETEAPAEPPADTTADSSEEPTAETESVVNTEENS